MTGISALAILFKMAPELLVIESIVIGLFLIFAMFSVWVIRDDPAILLPRTRFTEFFLLGSLPLLWFVFTYMLGFDQVLFALELALAILVSTIHPAIATGFFIVLLFLRPWEIVQTADSLFSALPRGFAYLAVVTSWYYLYRSKNLNLRLGAPTLFLFLFAFWTFLSTFKASDPSTAQSAFFDVFFKSVILFLLVTQAVRDRKAYRILKASFIFAALGISAISIYRTVMTEDLSGVRLGTFGLLADPNDVSAVMILIFPFAFYILRRGDRSLFLKVICAITILSSFLLIYFAKSRGALLSLLIMLGSMALLTFKNKRNAVLGALIAACLFVPVTALFNRSATDTADSTDSRIIYWKAGGYMALHSPIFGVGFGGYPENFEKYAPEIIEYGQRTAHSSWILALAETGVLGLVFFLALFLWTLRAAWRVRENLPELFFATLGYGVAMSFLSHTYSIYFYLLIALVFVGSKLSDETTEGTSKLPS